MIDAMRDLSEIELHQVSGGDVLTTGGWIFFKNSVFGGSVLYHVTITGAGFPDGGGQPMHQQLQS